MSSPPVTMLICHLCDAPIQSTELDEGLAVRVNGELLCAMCVDTLPVEAQVKINQLRAIKGLSATTYSVDRPTNPNLHLFTFTTIANITFHRRKLASEGSFSAPSLPPPTERVQSSQPAPAPAGATHATRRAPRKSWPWVLGVVVLVAMSGGTALFIDRHQGAAAHSDQPPLAPQISIVPLKTRNDYAPDPLQAWIQVSQDSECPELVRRAITLEVIKKRQAQLDQADIDLNNNKLDDATLIANAFSLPDDITFRDVRQREQDLRSRLLTMRTLVTPKIIDTPVVTPPPKIEVTPPAVTHQVAEPVTTTTAPVVAATVTPTQTAPVVKTPTTPATPVQPVTAPVHESFISFSGKELLGAEPEVEWKQVHNSLQLTGDYCTIVRGLMLGAGQYQVWLLLHSSAREGTINVKIGSYQTQTIEVKGSKDRWAQVRRNGDPVFTLPSGETIFEISAGGRGVAITDVVIADSSLPNPERSSRQPSSPPTWGPTTKPVVIPGAPTQVIWRPRFVQAENDNQNHQLPLDGSVYLPAHWPGGVEGFWKSLKTPGKHTFSMTLDFRGIPNANGGIVLLLNPGRLDRKRLMVSAVDIASKSTVVALAPITFSGTGAWESFIIPTPVGLPTGQISAVILDDDPSMEYAPDDGGFLIAKGAVTSNQPATVGMLEIRPPALISDEHFLKHLMLFMTELGQRRKHGGRSYDPSKLRVLASPLLNHQWRSETQMQLDDLFPTPLAENAIETISFDDAWLDAMFKQQAAGQPAILDQMRDQFVLLVTGSNELKPHTIASDAIDDFWKKRVAQLVHAGMFPVVTVGPALATGDRRGEIDVMWAAVLTMLATNLPGLPVIDLRSTPVAPNGELSPDSIRYSSHMIADGYKELIYWIHRAMVSR